MFNLKKIDFILDQFISGASFYESVISSLEIPQSLSSDQRSALIYALLGHFQAGRKSSKTELNHTGLRLPSDCLNAMLRLLLRFSFSSKDSSVHINNCDFLSVLFNYPHTKEFSSEYSAFVGVLIAEVRFSNFFKI